MKSVDIVIIGAGVVGASVAYHLAARGLKSILVIDRGKEPGDGSTGKATGGFRCQFATEVNIRLSLLSRAKLLQFEHELGVDSGYRQYGYFFIAQTVSELNALRHAQKIQRQCGLEEIEEISFDDIHRINPSVSVDGLAGGVYCSTDGYIRPINIMQGYMNAARRLGVRFEFGVECQGFVSGRGRVTEVHTSIGTIAVNTVVNAAGAWAGVVAAKAGINLPVVPLRRQVAVVQENGLLPDTMPMTIFVGDGFHLRVRDGKILLLMPTDVPSSFETLVDATWVEEVCQLGRQRIIPLRECNIDLNQCWAGLYEMSPDKHAMVGVSLEFDNFYLINGSSGHGVMHAPALGQLLSEIVLGDGSTSVDIYALRPSRFAEGQPNPMTEFL